MAKKAISLEEANGLTLALNILQNKYTFHILWVLKAKPKRFGEIKDEVPGLTTKMVTQQLKFLISEGMITRKSYPEIPPRVEYKLTETGKAAIPALEALNKYGLSRLLKKKEKEPVEKKPATAQLDLFG
jgi:DNA-binding HxlR family transcriptional regulator